MRVYEIDLGNVTVQEKDLPSLIVEELRVAVKKLEEGEMIIW